MADRNAWEPLVQNLEKFFPNLSPQVLPGTHDAKMVLQAIQSGLNDSNESRVQLQAHCKWCGRVVSSDSETFNIPQESKTTVDRILTWHIDWTKNVLKIEGAELSCQECQLLLNLSRLLNFLVSLDKSTDSTMLYSFASHFCQINGHTSQSGEDDIMLLQQAVSVAHSLHIITKNMPDLKIQGPNGKNVTLESVNDVLEHFSQPLVSSSAHSSTSKSKQKKMKEESSTEDANTTQQSNPSMTELKMSSKKKKKKKLSHESLANGHHTSDEKDEGGIDHIKDTSVGSVKRKHLVLSEKRKKGSAGKVKLGKKRRSLPAMKLD